MKTIKVAVNPGKEIYEIASDFADPIELIREALHNSYDAGAINVSITARTQAMPDGRRVLSVEIEDDGNGMHEAALTSFFGLGFTEKPILPDRPTIGFKGHGTKIYYQSQEITVVTCRKGNPPLVAKLTEARTAVNRKDVPQPKIWSGREAETVIAEDGLKRPGEQGTVIRLVDFTPDGSRAIDLFRSDRVENYLRWFTIFGSFRQVVNQTTEAAPLRLLFQGTDKDSPKAIEFGHPWPEADCVNLKTLKSSDDRRPFNFFCKTFREKNVPIDGGYKIDIAAVIEGARGRFKRDQAIRRQRTGGLYLEEERYGLWLCKNHIPVEKKFEWLFDDDCPMRPDEARRLLIFVNCENFQLTANRGSVGNSSSELLQSVKKAVFSFLESLHDDKDMIAFSNEYQEDFFSRLKEKDKKALQRRVERYNKKNRCTIVLPNGKEHHFFEPGREITLFGLISELNLLDPSLLALKILDYDDHVGIDLLVSRNGDPGHLLEKDRVAYTELKYELKSQINHVFDHLHAIVCWETDLVADKLVVDPTGRAFSYRQIVQEGVTHSDLIPPPGDDHTHSVKVLVLKRLLRERCGLQIDPNPNQLTHHSAAPSSASGSKPKRRRI